MRILVIAACPVPWPRGTPIRIHRMAEALVARGHEVHLATYPLGDDSVGVSYRLHRAGDPDTTLDPSPGPSLKKLFWLDPQLWRVVKRLLTEMSFDVIHAHHYEGLITALLARRYGPDVPIVYDSHTLLATELPHYRLRLPRNALAQFGAAVDRSLPPRADHIIAVTERMRQWFQDAASIPGRATLVDPQRRGARAFQSTRARRRRIVRQAQRRERPRTAHRVRWQPGGVPGNRRVARCFRPATPHVRCDARLVLVTDSELGPVGAADRVSWASIRRRGRGKGRISTELPTHLGAADVLVNPRVDCDGIPQKLLNYMAAGRPIVSFAGSAPVLEHGGNAPGRAGRGHRLIRRGDPAGAALAGAGRRARALRARRDAVEATFSWQRVARDVESAYAKVIGRPGEALMARAPVLLLGLDAADADVVERLAGLKGRLPQLQQAAGARRIRPARHSRGIVYAGGVWPTFYTGSGRAMARRLPQQALAARGDARGGGRRALDRQPPLLGVPLGLGPALVPDRCPDGAGHAQAPMNGVHLSGWGTHDVLSKGAWPRGLWQELAQPARTRPGNAAGALRRTEPPVARPTVRGAQGRHTAACRTSPSTCCGATPWDLACVVLGATHRAGHYLWDDSQVDP
jgi:glycosyltransferase involved in cell wall biosynthesis